MVGKNYHLITKYFLQQGFSAAQPTWLAAAIVKNDDAGSTIATSDDGGRRPDPDTSHQFLFLLPDAI